MQVNRVMSGASKVVGWIERSKPVKKLGNFFVNQPEKAVAYTTVASVIIKDGVGCYKYVTQSLKNDKIPEDKRKFVAALDLTNGILMILAQIGMFFAMRKFSEPLFDKLFNKTFGGQARGNLINRIRAAMGDKAPRKSTIDKVIDTNRKAGLDIFKFVAELAAATIIGKRVIVPFIATPLAQKVEKLMDAKGMNKTATNNTTEPQAQPEVGQKLDVVESASTNLLDKYRRA